MTNQATKMLARVAPALPLVLQDEVKAFLRNQHSSEEERGLSWFCVWCLRWTRGHGVCSHCGREGGL